MAGPVDTGLYGAPRSHFGRLRRLSPLRGSAEPPIQGFSGPERRFRLSYEHGSPDRIFHHEKVIPQVLDKQRRRVVSPDTARIAERLEVVLGDCNSGIFSGLDNHTAKTTALPVQG